MLKLCQKISQKTTPEKWLCWFKPERVKLWSSIIYARIPSLFRINYSIYSNQSAYSKPCDLIGCVYLTLSSTADNILVKNGDWLKIADFGLATQIPDMCEAVYEGFYGTPHFMAPEVSWNCHLSNRGMPKHFWGILGSKRAEIGNFRANLVEFRVGKGTFLSERIVTLYRCYIWAFFG